MLKKEITFENYDGTEKKETYYFHINEVELLELDTDTQAGFVATVEKIGKEQDRKALFELFKRIILMSIGERSPDGNQFVKNDEIRQRFMHTPAYSALFVEILSDANKASAFINGVIPKALQEEAKRLMQAEETNTEE